MRKNGEQEEARRPEEDQVEAKRMPGASEGRRLEGWQEEGGRRLGGKAGGKAGGY